MTLKVMYVSAGVLAAAYLYNKYFNPTEEYERDPCEDAISKALFQIAECPQALKVYQKLADHPGFVNFTCTDQGRGTLVVDTEGRSIEEVTSDIVMNSIRYAPGKGEGYDWFMTIYHPCDHQTPDDYAQAAVNTTRLVASKHFTTVDQCIDEGHWSAEYSLGKEHIPDFQERLNSFEAYWPGYVRSGEVEKLIQHWYHNCLGKRWKSEVIPDS